MSVKAYVMFNIEAGKIPSVVDELARIEGVNKAYPITGDYDAIAEIELEKPKLVEKLIVNKIQIIQGVKKTTTHIAFR